MLSRRDLIRLGLISAGAAALPAAKLVEVAIGKDIPPGNGPTGPASPPVTPFVAQLPIPTPLVPTFSDAAGDHYDIFEKEADVQLLPGPKTRMLTYNGQFPGPMIVATLDRAAIVTYHNQLSIDTTIHNHGEYVNGSSDGHPDDFIRPGTSKTFFYPNTNEKDPADVVTHTQWFHDHTEHATASNVYHGLAGLYLFNDPKDASLNLPSGAADIPLVITDKLFNADNSLFYQFGPNGSDNGFLGDVMQVNGAAQPRLEVGQRKYRFRFLNACDSRNLQLALSTGVPFTLISSEAGYLEQPAPTPSVFMAPAERYEVVVDFAKYPIGTNVVLKNLQGGNRTTNLLRFEVAFDAVDTSTRACTLAHHPADSRGAGNGAAAFPVPSWQRAVADQWKDVRPQPHRRPATGRGHGDLDARQRQWRLAPPDPHPPAQLPGARSERQAAVAAGIQAGRRPSSWVPTRPSASS